MRALFLVFLLPLFALAAEDDFTIYTAKHRPASELAQIAKGLVSGRAGIETMNDKVIINASKATTATVLKLFAEIDQRPRRFRVGLRLRGDGTSQSQGGDVSGGTTTGVRVRVDSRESAARSQGTQVIEVLEDAESSMSAGGETFLIRLRALGEKKVRATIRQVGGDKLGNSHALNSEVDLPLARWTELGRSQRAGESSGKVILGRRSGSERADRQWELRVEALDKSK